MTEHWLDRVARGMAERADGSNPINRTNNTAFDVNPAWSPDGKQIAFESNRRGNVEIYTMAANGTNPTRRTKNAANDHGANWQRMPQ